MIWSMLLSTTAISKSVTLLPYLDEIFIHSSHSFIVMKRVSKNNIFSSHTYIVMKPEV